MSSEEPIIQSQEIEDRLKALIVPSTLKSLIEGLIFAAEEPLTVKQLKAIYEYSAPAGSGVEPRKLEAESIRNIITGLNQDYKQSDRPYRIIQVAGGYQFATLKEYAVWLGKLRREQARRKLSQSGVETLAIIAYKQPVAKAEVESIRGVNCDYVLKTLLEKELVTVTGRAETVGRPLLYGTTREFLKHFGLNEVTDLPRPREIEEILGETQFETERRMLEAQLGAEKAKEDEDFKSRLPHIPKRKTALEGTSVEIVARTKRRDLKTTHGPELPFVELAADQTPLEFVVPEYNSAKSPEVEENINVALAPRSESVDRPQEASPSAPEVVSGITDAIPTQSEQTVMTVDNTIVPTETPLPDDTKNLKVEGTKNRWQSWKEKIQGFIRRLLD